MEQDSFCIQDITVERDGDDSTDNNEDNLVTITGTLTGQTRTVTLHFGGVKGVLWLDQPIMVHGSR